MSTAQPDTAQQSHHVPVSHTGPISSTRSTTRITSTIGLGTPSAARSNTAPVTRAAATTGGETPMLTQLLDLKERAAVSGAEIPCRENDAELWFAETPDGVEFAKALCRTCPVRATCLAGALERREPWGVWGGELFIQGVVVARKRPRGRPRKNQVAA